MILYPGMYLRFGNYHSDVLYMGLRDASTAILCWMSTSGDITFDYHKTHTMVGATGTQARVERLSLYLAAVAYLRSCGRQPHYAVLHL